MKSLIAIIITVFLVDFFWVYKEYWWHWFFAIGFIMIGFYITSYYNK